MKQKFKRLWCWVLKLNKIWCFIDWHTWKTVREVQRYYEDKFLIKQFLQRCKYCPEERIMEEGYDTEIQA